MLIYILLFILFISVSVTVTGGKKNTVKNDIITELSQYPANRVNTYLKLNNIDNVIKSNNITNTSDFFAIENITKNTFYTGLQTELLKQNPGKKFTRSALLLNDTELLNAYNKGINLFKN